LNGMTASTQVDDQGARVRFFVEPRLYLIEDVHRPPMISAPNLL
jgi:hypothetical protein